MDNQETFGLRMRKARKKAGLKQQELADKTGIAVTSIRRYESGERSPTNDYVLKIAEALGASIIHLQYGSAAVAEATTRPRERLKDIFDELVKEEESRKTAIAATFDKLNPTGQEKAIERVGELAELPKYLK